LTLRLRKQVRSRLKHGDRPADIPSMELSGLLILGFSGALAGGALWIGARWLRAASSRRAGTRRSKTGGRSAGHGSQRVSAAPTAGAPAPPKVPTSPAAVRPSGPLPVLRDALPQGSALTEPGPGTARGAAHPPAARPPVAHPPAPVLQAAAWSLAAEGPETRPGWGESSFFPPTQPTALSEYGTQFAETQPMPVDLR
jgi:hypothetical protein